MSKPFARRLGLVAALIGALAIGSTIAAERSSSTMARAAMTLVKSLAPAQLQQAAFPFESDERTHWHFIPTETFPRKGLLMRDMSPTQHGLMRDLLKAGLSQRGYLTATSIMDLETVLKALEAAQRAAGPQPPRGTPLERDPEKYFFSIFGTPTPTQKATWGWRIEGHHVSLHFTIVDGMMVAASPSFFGSNPAEVREGPSKGLRILGAEEDAARTLLQSLDPPQRARAIIDAAAPGDMLTMANVDINPLSPSGLEAAAMTAPQRDLLLKLLDVYSGMMAADLAEARLARVRKAGFDKVAFAWAGDTERGRKHYYRVQGPTFLIEYDNTQNDGNHIHSVWRDFNGDFGRDLLREHLRSVAH
jgi:hypothetical protein